MDVDRSTPCCFVCFDLETTGLIARGQLPHIVSIGWSSCDVSDQGRRSGEILVMPQIEIEPAAARVHGYTRERLIELNAASIGGALDTFFEALDAIAHGRNIILVAHNGQRFDEPILHAAVRGTRRVLPRTVLGFVDTLHVARQLHAPRPHSLDALLSHYNLPRDRPVHGARLDSELLAGLVACLPRTAVVSAVRVFSDHATASHSIPIETCS